MGKITMLHARQDYMRIQDPDGKIGRLEPVMLFRAQDKHFCKVVEYYAQLLAADGIDQRELDSLYRHIALANRWPVKKKPDWPILEAMGFAPGA